MREDSRLVWSDEQGDLRKKKQDNKSVVEVDVDKLELHLRRLTSGKGRTVIEITNLPSNKNFCKKIAKDLKKALGVGGAYKNDFIEVHGEKMDEIVTLLNSKGIKFKKIGG